MLKLLQDTKMNLAGANFTVPKGFYIYTDDETVQPDGLIFLPPEYDCQIMVYAKDCKRTDNVRNLFIMQFTNNDPLIDRLKLKSNFSENIRNYLYSISAEYEYGNIGYYEINFGQIKGYDERLIFIISVDKRDARIKNILGRADIQKFIYSFEEDK